MAFQANKIGIPTGSVKRGIPLLVFAEPFVGSFVSDFSASLFQPTDSTVLLVVEFGHIGLDVQERRPVEDVHVLKVQGASPDLDKSDDGKPYRIGPFRCSCGKDAPRFRVEERGNGELVTAALMELVKKNQMGETVKVLQSFSKFGIKVHSAVDSFRARGLDGHVFQFLEGRVNDADGTIDNVSNFLFHDSLNLVSRAKSGG